jgi:adenosylhomocysteine nucleosidase
MTKLGIITGMAFEAAILKDAARKGTGAAIIAHGLGREAARSAAEDAIRQGARTLMSFGIAGGLDPKLRAGTVVVAAEVRDRTKAFLSDALWAAKVCEELRLDSNRTTLAHADHVLTTPAEKAALFAVTGAAAADMESFGVAEAAAAHGLPFLALRVIADGAYDSVPRIALAATTADGHVRVMETVFRALTSPGQIPELIRLGKRTAVAKSALARLADLGLERSFFVSL